VLVEPSHWLHETFIAKTFCLYFWHGQMVGAQTLGDSIVCVSIDKQEY
jgi:hypothetical protein